MGLVHSRILHFWAEVHSSQCSALHTTLHNCLFGGARVVLCGFTGRGLWEVVPGFLWILSPTGYYNLCAFRDMKLSSTRDYRVSPLNLPNDVLDQ